MKTPAFLAAAALALGAASTARAGELVVTLKAPPLARAGLRAASPRGRAYLERLAREQDAVRARILRAVPAARFRWRYRIVLDGIAVVVPQRDVSRLARVPGVARVWQSVQYAVSSSTATTATFGPAVDQIGASQLWGPSFATAGNGIKIGIIDEGVDQTHPFLDPNGFRYPPGFPKGQTAYTTPKVIVARAFAPANATGRYATKPFDPTQSFHATHVAGIAAGDYGVVATAGGRSQSISGVAPNAYIGNYKALSVLTPDFGLDGNSPEIAAAIESAVADGMNVINLSLGEPEIDPGRDLVVQAIEGAAAAGVVPVVAAGNDFDSFGFGSVSSPGNSPSAITVAAATRSNTIADFSSGGPTPVSLTMKPDVTAPGVGIVSSVPPREGLWEALDGTSMATPHVAGAAALLLQRHPGWTVAQVKSALTQTGDPVGRPESSTLREGGGLIDLPRADQPFVFASPSAVAFGQLQPGGAATARTVELADAGGGAGAWAVSVQLQPGAPATVSAPPTATVPGPLLLTGSTPAGARTGDATGFVVLTRGADVRRIPFWLGVAAPVLGSEPHTLLARTGTYRGSTVGKPSLVTTYRYPDGPGGSNVSTSLAGPEQVYRVRVTHAIANFGVAVLSGRAQPRVTFAGNEDHLVGYTGLPLYLNPYSARAGSFDLVAGAVLPALGDYDIVFDEDRTQAPGPFTFRFWIDDTTPPRLRLLHAGAQQIVVSITDAGAGVDPASIAVSVDGVKHPARFRGGRFTVAASRGRHRLLVRASDYQEAKNMEDVPRIFPNTATLRAPVLVR